MRIGRNRLRSNLNGMDCKERQRMTGTAIEGEMERKSVGQAPKSSEQREKLKNFEKKERNLKEFRAV